MTNFKSGLYRLEMGGDIFSDEGWTMGKVVEARLTEKEAKFLFSGGLFIKLGFVGWTWLKE